jgi:aspartyl-tRNA(Asn)/glutamyl-tRNA(Gln) amidotransferase subunit A
MTNPNQLTIAAARDALRKGELSAVDLTMSCLTAMDAGDDLNAFVHKTPDIALTQARAADVRLKAGGAPDLCGIPLGIKDLFCTKGVPSQAASKILAGFKPEYESTVTTKLFEAGAVMLGKLNMDEFAMGSSTEHSGYHPTKNPWDVTRAPGGSGGGSASAVASAHRTSPGSSITPSSPLTALVLQPSASIRPRSPATPRSPGFRAAVRSGTWPHPSLRVARCSIRSSAQRRSLAPVE